MQVCAVIPQCTAASFHSFVNCSTLNRKQVGKWQSTHANKKQFTNSSPIAQMSYLFLFESCSLLCCPIPLSMVLIAALHSASCYHQHANKCAWVSQNIWVELSGIFTKNSKNFHLISALFRGRILECYLSALSISSTPPHTPAAPYLSPFLGIPIAHTKEHNCSLWEPLIWRFDSA